MKFLFAIVCVSLIAGGFYYCNVFYPGTVRLDWLDNQITLTVPVAFLSLVIIYLLFIIVNYLIRKALSLTQIFANYKNKKHQQRSNDQLWITFQSIQLNGLPFPEQILEQLIHDKSIDHRIPLSLIITNRLNQFKEIKTYLNQLQQLPFTQATCLYADIKQLHFQEKYQESLSLYQKLIDLTASISIQVEYHSMLLQQAKYFLDHQNFDKMFDMLKDCESAFLVLHNLDLYGQYGLLMSQYYQHTQQFNKATQIIELTWIHKQTLNLYEVYKVNMQAVTFQHTIDATQRLASFAPHALMSYQIIIEAALEGNAISDAKAALYQLQSHFPQNPLIHTYQNKLMAI